MIDQEARKQILAAINLPFESWNTQKIKSNIQRELYNVIFSSFKDGKVSIEEATSVYTILSKGNYSAWEGEFKDLYQKFQLDQDIHTLLNNLLKLIHQFKIESRIATKFKNLGVNDLTPTLCSQCGRPLQ